MSLIKERIVNELPSSLSYLEVPAGGELVVGGIGTDHYSELVIVPLIKESTCLAREAGTIDVTQSDLEGVSCLGKSLIKSGQDNTVDLCGCVNDVQIGSSTFRTKTSSTSQWSSPSFAWRFRSSARRAALWA